MLLPLAASFAQDNWLGGTGNWSNSGQWSLGAPLLTSDVVIYSGGNDLVYLDASANINSLTLAQWPMVPSLN